MGESAESSTSTAGRSIRMRSATALVVANIIGAGIYTTTGFQAAELGHPGYIFGLWIVGGILAICGALSYAELGAAMPKAGGEYIYLRETFGPAVGFMSAFVSLIGGFSAPIASAVKGLVRYMTHFFPSLVDEPTIGGMVSVNDLIAVGFVWLLVAIHLRGLRGGIGFNDFVTMLKVGGLVVIVLAAAVSGKGAIERLMEPSATHADLEGSDLFAALGTSLIFVMFCYSGWNAAAYVAGEMDDPQRNLPRSLLIGTGIVLLLYLGMNGFYFYAAGIDALAGKVEVGLIAAREVFGPTGVTAVTLVMCVSLLSSASAMTIVGPRVYYAVGKDYPQFASLGKVNPHTGAPTVALLAQGIVTSVIVVSGRIDQIMGYAGFLLALFSSLAVACVIVLRIKRPEMVRPFRTWGYPVTPLLFLAMSAWMMFWAMQGRPTESSLALATVVAGGIVFKLTTGKRQS